MKKLISLMLALVMILSMAVVASADEPQKKTSVVTNYTGHEYHAYQIFSGTQAEGEAMLGQLDWGSGIDDDRIAALMAELKDVSVGDKKPFATCENAEAVARILASSGNGAAGAKNTAEALAFAKVVHKYVSTVYVTISSAASSSVELEVGYYLLKDSTDNDGITGGVTGLSMLQITGDEITITSKTDKPMSGKKVQDEVGDKDSNSMDTVGGWGETADHAINESFCFELRAIIPADVNIEQYEKYKVVFNDTMSAGITFEQVEKVMINDVEIPVGGYTLSDNAVNGAAGIKWTLTIEDIKPYLHGTSTAESTPQVTSSDINISVIYRAHLNESAVIAIHNENVTGGNRNDVFVQYSNNPNADGTGDMGQTTPDSVWVFTYIINATKYKRAVLDENVLAGAGFTLYTAEEYAKLIDKDDATVAVPVSLKKGADGNHYPVVTGTEGSYTEMVTEANGLFNVKGLDTGVYYLVETTVPSGYNKCDDIKVEISAVHKEVNETSATTHITIEKNDEIVPSMRIDVVNNAGATLPETGGIGTTIFYVLGAVLVLGAIVMLVTKKRMGTAE